MAYTERQLDILRGDAVPDTDEEIEWYEAHSSDIVPGDDGLRKSARRAYPSLRPKTTFNSSQPFVPPTLAGASADAMDETKDRLEKVGEEITKKKSGSA